MGIIDRVRAALGGAAEAKAQQQIALVPTWGESQPQYSETNFYTLARLGYRRNELVFACIGYRSSAAASTRLCVYAPDGMKIERHPALDLLRAPNPMMTEFDFWQTTIAMHDLAGSAYWWKERSRNGRVIGLWPLRPDRVTPIVSKRAAVEAYEYNLDGQVFSVPFEDVMSFTGFDPLNVFGGWSPAQVAARMVDVDNATTDYVKVFFQNAAMPRGLLTVKSKLTDGQAADIRERWRARYGGSTRWADVAVLDNDASYQQLGNTFKDMEFDTLDARNETRVCMVFGVPPILIGVKAGLDRSTYSNYKEARMAFWQDTMTPIFKHLADEYALAMRGEFGDVIDARFDLGGVPVMQEIQIERLVSAGQVYSQKLITRDEARQLGGLGAIDNAPVWFGATESTEPEPEMPEPADEPDEADAEREGKAAEMGVDEHRARLDAHAYKRDLVSRAYEMRFRDAAQNVLSAERGRVLAAIREAKAEPDLGATGAGMDAAIQQSRAEWIGGFTELFTQLITDTGAEIAAEFGIAFDITSAEMAAFIATYVPQFADQVVSTSRNAIVIEMLNNAAEFGWSIQQLADFIKDKYTDWNDVRATMIARTETIRAANAGAHAAMQGQAKQKQWLATMDNRTRDWHREADGQVVAMDQPFTVMGERLMYPGDPRGSAENVIQCRCTVVPVL